jgi:RNA polymerase primary sigma factor
MASTRNRADDPVSAYMKQVGQTPLLTREQEVTIFKTIEDSQEVAKEILYKNKICYDLYQNLAEDLIQGKEKVDDVIKTSSAISYMKTLPRLLKALTECKKAERSKKIYNRFKVKQSLIDQWCHDISDKGHKKMKATLKRIEKAKSSMIKANLRLVIANAKKHNNRGVAFLDLIQEGNLGLLKAVEKFEYKRGYKFSTYATWWIRQAITKCVGDTGRTIRVPMHMISTMNKIFSVQRQLLQAEGREPSTEEIAAELGMPPSRIETILKAAMHPISLDTPVGDGGNTTVGDFVEDKKVIKNDDVVLSSYKGKLFKSIETLTDREYIVIQMRFGMKDGKRKTLEEVADTFNITRERIRQIEAKTLRKITVLAKKEVQTVN